MKGGRMLGLLGYAEVKVIGRFPEKFINLAAANGVRMWDTEISTGEMVFKTDIYSLKRLWGIHHKTGCTIQVKRKAGLLVAARYLVRRKFLLAGFLFFMVTLYLLAGLVWEIEIIGLEELTQEQVIESVQPMGVRQWAQIKNIDLNAIEDQLYIQFPQIAWVAVDRSGTKISIRIVEKDYDPLQFGKAIDIVAEYDGIISEMMVLQGIAMVEPGMTVSKGDVLISGYSSANGMVNAAGSVKAMVFVEGYGEAALVEVERVATGNSKHVNFLQISNFSIALSPREHGFEHFEVTETIRPMRGKINLPIIMLSQNFQELKLITHRYSQEQAQDMARERAMISAHLQIGEHADIVKKEIKDITLENSVFRYKVLITTETIIGKEEVQTRGGNN